MLIDQLKHDDSVLRINAAKNLIQIGTLFLYEKVVSKRYNFILLHTARSLGPDRTRSELIPFLTGNTSFINSKHTDFMLNEFYIDSVDDEDEVIAVIAEKLGI